MTKTKKWIQGATKEGCRGSLTKDVRQRYGKKGFTARGTIKKSVLTELSQDKNMRTGKTTKVARKARMALNIRKRK